MKSLVDWKEARSRELRNVMLSYSFSAGIIMYSDTPLYNDPSSVHRLARVRALPRPSD